MNAATSQTVLNLACIALKRALPNVWAIYAYGSVARGDDHPGSDLDLAVLLPPGESLPDKLTLISAVAEAAGRDVDLVDIRHVNLDLVHEILRDGVPLFVRSQADVLTWEAERMTDYALFNPRRREILDVYLREPLRP